MADSPFVPPTRPRPSWSDPLAPVEPARHTGDPSGLTTDLVDGYLRAPRFGSPGSEPRPFLFESADYLESVVSEALASSDSDTASVEAQIKARRLVPFSAMPDKTTYRLSPGQAQRTRSGEGYARGLYVLIARTRGGKTRALEAMFDRQRARGPAAILPCGEPDALLSALSPLDLSVFGWIEALLMPSTRRPIWLVDSLREWTNKASGAAGPGGIPRSLYTDVFRLHRAAIAADVTIVASINPLLEDSAKEDVVAKNLDGSCLGSGFVPDDPTAEVEFNTRPRSLTAATVRI